MKPLAVTREDDRVVLTVQHGEDSAIATMSPKTALWLAGQLMDAANVSVLIGHRDSPASDAKDDSGASGGSDA